MVKPLTTVLVAEDEADIRELLVDILADAGYEVICVDDGTKALNAARSQRPDIVLLDVMMPGMDGFQV
jgi:two-component system alkaline phosphatase synthesis response regulator PhoP